MDNSASPKQQDHREDTLVRIIAKYSSSRFYEQLLSLLNSFIRPKLLLPELYGLWHTLITIPGYAVYSNFGVHSSMRYLIPYHESRKEHEETSRITGSVVYGSLFTKIVIALALVIPALAAEMSLKVRLGLLTMACVVILEWYIGYYTSVLEAMYQFRIISVVNYVRTTVAFVGSVVLIYFFNIYGLYAATLFTLSITILYLRWKYPLWRHKRFERSVFVRLVKQGFPIMIFNLCTDLISSSDKLMIAGIIGTENVGYYAIAIMVHHFVMNIPVAARSINETRLMRNLQKETAERILGEYFFKPLIATAYFMPFLIGSVVVILPVVIPVLLPQYSAGVVPAQILTLGCYFFSLFFVTRGIIVAHQLQVKASAVMFGVVALHVTLGVLLLKSGLGIGGMAAVSSFSLFMLFLSIFLFLTKKINFDGSELKRNIAALTAPFPVMLGVLITLHMLFRGMPVHMYLKACLELVVYNTVMLLFVMLSRKWIPTLKGIKLQDM